MAVVAVVALGVPSRSAAAVACAGPDCDTVVFVDDAARFYLYEDLVPTSRVGAFYFGDPADEPLAGDWDCDGEQTPAAYRRSEGYVYLRDSNSQGIADAGFYLGNPGDVPLAGDFDGDGCDTIGVYRPSEGMVYISNSLGPGLADVSYHFGDPGDSPFVGDFDGDGIDTIGLHRRSTGLVYFRDTHAAGPADRSFVFGDPGDVIVAGDWDGDGLDTVAAYRRSTGVLYLTSGHGSGVADHQMSVGRFRHAIRVAGVDEIAGASFVPVGIPGNWHLIFDEPFDVFDETTWQPRYEWTPVVINNELQHYLPSAVRVSDGHLHLVATRDAVNGQAFTSGVVTSYGKFAFLYGAVEIRAKAPSGQGLLSAFWMLPDSHDYPPELDVVEVDGSQRDLAHVGFHSDQGSDRLTSLVDDLTDGYHTYGVTWDPGVIVWYVDGVEIHRHTGPRVPAQHMYLLANLAVGGWVGDPDGSTPFPSELVVDHIRVWQRS